MSMTDRDHVPPAPTATLVPMGPEHLDATYRWLRDSETLRLQIDSLTPPTPEGNEAYWKANWANPSRDDFAIVGSDGIHLGNCGLSSIDRVRNKAELWIYLGDRRGGGAGAAAIAHLLHHGFEVLRLNRVYLRVVSDNPRAASFYLRNGFVEEGRFRQDSRHGDVYVDSIWLSVLASEYEARRGIATPERPR